jgi:hypothetical protein
MTRKGKLVRFWHDKTKEEPPLILQYLNLFLVSQMQDCTMEEAIGCDFCYHLEEIFTVNLCINGTLF